MRDYTERIVIGLVAAGLMLLICATLFPFREPRPGSPEKQTEQKLRALQHAIGQYKGEYGFYPVGSAREILKSLLGNNPKNFVFIEGKPGDFDPVGDMFDYWKTPIRLSRSSDDEMPLLTSAGKDKVFGTADDITLPPEQ